MGDLQNASRGAPRSPGMAMMGMVGVGPIGVAGAAPATPISLAKGMKVDFELDDTFVDVDTLLGMEDADMLLGSYYSPFRNANAGGVPQPMGAAPTSVLERMATTIAPALHSIAASGGLQQQQQHTQPHVVARSHLSPSAARIAHSPLSATPGSAVRRSFRLTPQKHVYNHPSRSPYRARGLNVNGVGDAAHAAAAPPGAVAVAGAGAGAVMDSSYVFKSPTLELGNTYDAMSLGIGDGSFLVGNPNTQPSSSRGLVGAQSTHVYQKQRSSSSGAGKSSSKKKKQTGSGGGGSGPTKAAMPKRGEYKCGKCGYFPKKTKHNCDNERVKRTAAGLPTGKGSAGSSKMPLSAEMMQAKEYQYGAPIKIKFGDVEPY